MGHRSYNTLLTLYVKAVMAVLEDIRISQMEGGTSMSPVKYMLLLME